MILDFLKDLFNPQAANRRQEALFRESLKSLKQKNPNDIPVNLRCVTLHLLIEKVLLDAETKNLYVKPGKGALIVDENQFSDEMEIITRYQKSLNFSAETQDLFIFASLDLAKEIEEAMPFRETEPLWPYIPLDHKKEILNRVLKKQAEIFSRSGLKFESAEVVFEKSPIKNILAHVMMPTLDKKDFMLPKVSINKELLQDNNFSTVMLAAVHEGMHNIMSQLARKYFTGEIGKSHPFYNDAHMIFEMRTNNSYCPVKLRSGYFNDPEESLVTQGHQIFDGCYSAIPTLEKQIEENPGLCGPKFL